METAGLFNRFDPLVNLVWIGSLQIESTCGRDKTKGVIMSLEIDLGARVDV